MSIDKDHRGKVILPNAARRRFLKLAYSVAPAVSIALLLPTSLWAKPAGGQLTPKLTGEAPQVLAKPRPPRLLMIDPGHGGHDPGAIGLSGTREKDVTLDIARRMAEAVAREKGVDAKMTREQDVFLPLAERVEIGHKSRADMFVSIHADSAPNCNARGLSVYSLSKKASDQFANQLAEKENQADLIGGLHVPVEDQEVAEILFDLAARHTSNTAQRVKVGFVKAMERQWQLLDQPMRSANFAVLRSPEVPSLLIETGFLSNKKDESLLAQPAQRQKIAELMTQELTFLMKSSLFG
ncbi:MAG: N-acetylmuramoyl-L-alanine amidase [Alphaproteobacteria bacterium]|nr:N-acetylmuramoyl-L-alanine amidase [Alphaproteobacteria bacterium]